MGVDPEHRYSNESERSSKDMYDDFKLEKTLWLPWFLKIIIQRFKGKQIAYLGKNQGIQG